MKDKTMKTQVSVDEWVAMFKDIGLDKPTMERWHRLFEKRHPDAHGAFLGWLGMPAEEIERVRQWSRQ